MNKDRHQNFLSESCLVFAARYAHTRNTTAPWLVVEHILSVWDTLSRTTQLQLIKECDEATCQIEEWDRIKKLKVKEED